MIVRCEIAPLAEAWGVRLQSEGIGTRELTLVRGIGRWTAEMFLMFQLRRLDVWPTGDLGVRKGFGLAWGIPTPTPKLNSQSGPRFRSTLGIICRCRVKISTQSTLFTSAHRQA